MDSGVLSSPPHTHTHVTRHTSRRSRHVTSHDNLLHAQEWKRRAAQDDLEVERGIRKGVEAMRAEFTAEVTVR